MINLSNSAAVSGAFTIGGMTLGVVLDSETGENLWNSYVMQNYDSDVLKYDIFPDQREILAGNKGDSSNSLINVSYSFPQ